MPRLIFVLAVLLLAPGLVSAVPYSETEVISFCEKSEDKNSCITDQKLAYERFTAMLEGKFDYLEFNKAIDGTHVSDYAMDCAKNLNPDYKKGLMCISQKIERSKFERAPAAEKSKMFRGGEKVLPDKQYIGDLNKLIYSYKLKENRAEGAVASNSGARYKDLLNPGSNWRISCEKDNFTDKKTCRLYIFGERTGSVVLLIIFGKEINTPAICVGLKNYPGSKIQIRIDQNPHHSADAKTCFASESRALLEEIRKGDTILTRYQKWPSKQWIENEIKTTGVPLALELAQWLYDQ